MTVGDPEKEKPINGTGAKEGKIIETHMAGDTSVEAVGRSGQRAFLLLQKKMNAAKFGRQQLRQKTMFFLLLQSSIIRYFVLNKMN